MADWTLTSGIDLTLTLPSAGTFTGTLTIPDNFEDYTNIPHDYIRKSDRYYDNERELYNVCGTEMFNLWGTPVTYYFASHDTAKDHLWGEDTNRSFTSAHEIQAYFTLPNRSRVYNQFGIISVETFPIYISMDHFDKVTGGNGYAPYTGQKPKIGDVIRNHYRDPFGKTFYEISNVNYTESQFQQGQFFWTLTCKLFNDDHIKTTQNTSADVINDYTNKPDDIFDITNKINTLTSAWSGSLEPGNINLNGWF